MSAKVTPIYPENGSLRMYHMAPYRRYVTSRIAASEALTTSGAGREAGPIGIDDMIAYIPEVAAMGYNAVWGGPFQATGTFRHPHPGGVGEVTGSLYAMADDLAFNPLIFPGCATTAACEEKLRQWTAAVRLQGMFPLFDLVLNHVGRQAEGLTPLQTKLDGLLLTEINDRWPDIQGLDYYRTGSRKRGLNTEPKDLDMDKINAIFERLWVPFITRYINDYGFMGVRVDALTHVPVIVQQRAYELIRNLVRTKYGTEPFIVGEFMVSDPERFVDGLSACGLSHSLNPCSFYWGHNIEGGYSSSEAASPFLRLNKQLSAIVLPPPPISTHDFSELVIGDVLPTDRKLQAKTIYIYNAADVTYFALNHSATDICFGKSLKAPINSLAEGEAILDLLRQYHSAAEPRKKLKQQTAQAVILSRLQVSTSLQDLISQVGFKVSGSGLMGVMGNHDVGTLKAKAMLDIAYSRALGNAGTDGGKAYPIVEAYKAFKQLIKGIRRTDELAFLIQRDFHLNTTEMTQLFLDINMRMREKFLIQALMCSGGYYSLAGDEAGVCHKPEVFAEFARDSRLVGSSLEERLSSDSHCHDLRGFIRGVNALLDYLPKASYADRTTMHYIVLENEEFGVKPANILFLVVRYSAIAKRYYLMGHAAICPDEALLTSKLEEALASEPCLRAREFELFIINETGEIRALRMERVSPGLPIRFDAESPTPLELDMLTLADVASAGVLSPPTTAEEDAEAKRVYTRSPDTFFGKRTPERPGTARSDSTVSLDSPIVIPARSG